MLSHRTNGCQAPVNDELDPITPSVPNPKFVTKFPGGASRLAALLLPHIGLICSVVAPCDPGAALRDFANASRFQGTGD